MKMSGTHARSHKFETRKKVNQKNFPFAIYVHIGNIPFSLIFLTVLLLVFRVLVLSCSLSLSLQNSICNRDAGVLMMDRNVGSPRGNGEG